MYSESVSINLSVRAAQTDNPLENIPLKEYNVII